VEFFEVSNVEPSPEGGPLLEIEGAKWTAAVMHRSPPAGRSLEDPWALCYFSQDRMGLDSGSWKRISQPVRLYGDKHPIAQQLHLGSLSAISMYEPPLASHTSNALKYADVAKFGA
jgi:hypothetical protein